MDNSDKLKSEILENIRRAIANAPPSAVSGEPCTDLREPRTADTGSEITLQCFLEMLQVHGGEGQILADEEAAVSVLRGILSENRGLGVLISSDLELERLAVPRLIEEAGSVVLPQGDVSLERAAEAALGVTTAQAGIADTGTVVLFHTPERGRLAALLPSVHIVLLRRSRVFPDKISYLAGARQEGIGLGSTPMTWVTGPSLTADIEKVLVIGAHGPRRLIVLLY